MTEMEKFIHKKRAEGKPGFSAMHVLVASYIRMLSQKPGYEIDSFFRRAKLSACHKPKKIVGSEAMLSPSGFCRSNGTKEKCVYLVILLGVKKSLCVIFKVSFKSFLKFLCGKSARLFNARKLCGESINCRKNYHRRDDCSDKNRYKNFF